MNILLIILAAAVLGIVLPLILVKRAGRKAEAEMRAEHGGNLKLLTGCGVIDHINRVPGVLGLLPDSLVYRAILTGSRGGIPLSDIKSVILRPTKESPHRRTRKYIRGWALEIIDKEDRLHLFVVSSKDAPRWSEQLDLDAG